MRPWSPPRAACPRPSLPASLEGPGLPRLRWPGQQVPVPPGPPERRGHPSLASCWALAKHRNESHHRPLIRLPTAGRGPRVPARCLPSTLREARGLVRGSLLPACHPIWGLRGQPTPHRASAARGLPAWTPRGDGAAPAGAPPVWRNNAAPCPALSQRLRSGGSWALGCVTFVSKHHLRLFSDYEGHGALTLWGRPQTRYLRKQTWERRQRPSLKANYFVL